MTTTPPSHTFRIVPPLSLWNGRTAENRARIAAMQRLRGAAYVADGALPPSALDADGRHRSPHDETGYHLVAEHADGTLAGGLRVHVHPPHARPSDLHLAPALQRMTPAARAQHEQALEQLIATARERKLHFGEVGAWAVRSEDRNRRLGVETALAPFAFCELLGSVLAVAHATHRNHSAQILKRLGGWGLTLDGQPLEPLHDPAYGCTMEFVCFYSAQPAAAYAATVARLRTEFADQPPFKPEMSLRQAA